MQSGRGGFFPPHLLPPPIITRKRTTRSSLFPHFPYVALFPLLPFLLNLHQGVNFSDLRGQIKDDQTPPPGKPTSAHAGIPPKTLPSTLCQHGSRKMGTFPGFPLPPPPCPAQCPKTRTTQVERGGAPPSHRFLPPFFRVRLSLHSQIIRANNSIMHIYFGIMHIPIKQKCIPSKDMFFYEREETC